jgi:hypothetical protein
MDPPDMPDWRNPRLERGVTFALLLVCWVFCASNALNERIDRDEHMYLSAARLSEDFRIYEDFAFLQTPYSVGVYRAVLALAPDPWTLLPARIFKTIVTAAMITLLFIALRRFGARPLMAAGLITLLYMTDVIRDVAAYARNYDLAQMGILAGICIAPLRDTDPSGRVRMVLVGALASIAVGFKLTYAPLTVVLIAWPLTFGSGRRLDRATWLGAGAILGLIPAAVTMIGVDPAVLRLNLLDYHFLNAEYHAAAGNEPLSSFWDRLSRTAGTLLAREHRPLLAMSTFGLALNLAQWSRPKAWIPGPRAWFVIAFLVASVVLTAVPRPIQLAYFAPTFFGMTFFVAVATGRLTRGGRQTMLLLTLASVAVTGSLKFEKEWGLLVRASDPDNWTGIVTHRVGQQLVEITEPGRPVATLHPVFVLDAGLPIYRELATGPFAWRVGPFLGPELQALLHSTSAEGLDDLLEEHPPGAVVTKIGTKWDGSFVAWANDAAWRKQDSAHPRIKLWVP